MGDKPLTREEALDEIAAAFRGSVMAAPGTDEFTVAEIVERLGGQQDRIYAYLRTWKEAGEVTRRRIGYHVYYRIPVDKVRELLRK